MGSRAILGRVLIVVLIVLMAAVVAASILADNPSVWTGALAGAGVVVLGVTLYQLQRRWPRLIALGAALVVFAIGSLSYTFLGRGVLSPPGPTLTLTVPYHASGDTDGTTLTLHEVVVLDGATAEAIARSTSTDTPVDLRPDRVSMDGWEFAGLQDGYPTFKRDTTITGAQPSHLASTITARINLGTFRFVDSDGKAIGRFSMAPRTSSRVDITMPKDSLGRSYPGDPAAVEDSNGNQVVTLAVDQYAHDISVTVLKPFLRNSWGPAFYRWASHGFLWIFSSFLGVVLMWLLKDRLAALGKGVIRWLGRLVPRRRVQTIA